MASHEDSFAVISSPSAEIALVAFICRYLFRCSLSLNKSPGVSVLSLAVLASWGTIVQVQEITRGSIIATTCYTCHGTKGNSPGAISSINDISPERMKRILTEFRDGTRASTVMGRHASGYTDDEIAEVAQFFGNLQKQEK